MSQMKKGNRMIVFLMILRLFAGLSAARDIEITDSGIYPIKRLDTGMTFYVQLNNRANRPVVVRSQMINCCEIITPEDVDCEHIRLIGDHVGILPPGKSNVTLVWPTLYLHDRRGECEIGITYNTDGSSNLLRQKISFDTYVSNQSVPDILKGYYEANEVKRCSSVDEDSLDSCQPVKCLIKYSGKRNFFNKSLRRCQPVVVWVPDSGEAADSNIICHNGRQDNVTGMCICNEGWGTHQIDSLESSTESIHMCNFKTSPFSRVTNTGYSTTSLVILTVIIVSLLFFVLCCVMTLVTQDYSSPPGAGVELRSVLQQTSSRSSFDGSLERLIPPSSRMEGRKKKFDKFGDSYIRLTH
ncbi:GSCOCG00005144001-RA-CDS [Cotesia congregata]|nr:GSCOCG00005144001-RA-CDS [Cotesia congregata]